MTVYYKKVAQKYKLVLTYLNETIWKKKLKRHAQRDWCNKL